MGRNDLLDKLKLSFGIADDIYEQRCNPISKRHPLASQT